MACGGPLAYQSALGEYVTERFALPSHRSPSKGVAVSESFLEIADTLFSDRFRVSSALQGERLLATLHDERSFCTLILKKGGRTFTSIVLEVARHKGYLLMDAPHPDFSRGQPVKGEPLLVFGRANHLATGFASTFLEYMHTQDEEGIRLAYPGQVYQLQRRQFFRVPPAPGDPDLVELRRNGAQAVPGRLQNISGGGLSVLVRPPADYPFQAGERIAQVTFTLRGGHTFGVAAELRSVGPVELLHHEHVCALGLQFAGITPMMSEQVLRYAQWRDREMLSATRRGFL